MHKMFPDMLHCECFSRKDGEAEGEIKINRTGIGMAILAGGKIPSEAWESVHQLLVHICSFWQVITGRRLGESFLNLSRKKARGVRTVHFLETKQINHACLFTNMVEQRLIQS